MNEEGYEVWIDGGDCIADFPSFEEYGGEEGALAAAESFAKEKQDAGCQDWTIYYAAFTDDGEMVRLSDLDEDDPRYDGDCEVSSWQSDEDVSHSDEDHDSAFLGDGYIVWIDGGSVQRPFTYKEYGSFDKALDAATAYAKKQQEAGCEDWTIYEATTNNDGDFVREMDLDEHDPMYANAEDCTVEYWSL